MYNLRYHIASLVAVFLSLSIGLLLGTIVVERGTLDRQKEAIVRSLQDEFRTLDEANRELQAALTSQEDLVGTLVPLVVEGELEGSPVLVLASAGRADGLSAVNEAIVLAGGIPVTMMLSAPDFGLEDPAVSEVMSDLVGPVDETAIMASVVETLTSEWSTSVPGRPLTDVLSEAGVFTIDGDPGAETPVGAVVVLASFAGEPDSGALSFARSLADSGLPAVGVEAVTRSTGVADAAIELGLSTVDSMGMPEGTYSLVWVLSGRASGSFGYREGAQAPWPR